MARAPGAALEGARDGELRGGAPPARAPHFDEATKLAGITRPQVRDGLLGKLAEGYAAATVRNILGVLRGVLNAARFDDEIVKQNPCDRLPRVLPPRQDEPTEQALAPAALRQILDALASLQPRIYPLVVVAAATGLRLGEVLALQWADVDLAGGQLVVRHARDGRGRMDTPKGRKAARLPLPTPAVAALRELQKLPALSREPWCFPSPYSRKPWSRSHVYRVLHRACARAGLPAISMHVLRHSFISAAAATGADVWVVQQLARHASIKTTEGYVHLARTRPEHTQAMRAVEQHLFGPGAADARRARCGHAPTLGPADPATAACGFSPISAPRAGGAP